VDSRGIFVCRARSSSARGERASFTEGYQRQLMAMEEFVQIHWFSFVYSVPGLVAAGSTLLPALRFCDPRSEFAIGQLRQRRG
jgi:hypothetical protein